MSISTALLEVPLLLDLVEMQLWSDSLFSLTSFEMEV